MKLTGSVGGDTDPGRVTVPGRGGAGRAETGYQRGNGPDKVVSARRPMGRQPGRPSYDGPPLRFNRQRPPSVPCRVGIGPGRSEKNADRNWLKQHRQIY